MLHVKQQQSVKCTPPHKSFLYLCGAVVNIYSLKIYRYVIYNLIFSCVFESIKNTR